MSDLGVTSCITTDDALIVCKGSVSCACTVEPLDCFAEVQCAHVAAAVELASTWAALVAGGSGGGGIAAVDVTPSGVKTDGTTLVAGGGGGGMAAVDVTPSGVKTDGTTPS